MNDLVAQVLAGSARALARALTRVENGTGDAEALVAAIRVHLDAGVEPLRVSYRLAETAAWQAARRRAP